MLKASLSFRSIFSRLKGNTHRTRCHCRSQLPRLRLLPRRGRADPLQRTVSNGRGRLPGRSLSNSSRIGGKLINEEAPRPTDTGLQSLELSSLRMRCTERECVAGAGRNRGFAMHFLEDFQGWSMAMRPGFKRARDGWVSGNAPAQPVAERRCLALPLRSSWCLRQTPCCRSPRCTAAAASRLKRCRLCAPLTLMQAEVRRWRYEARAAPRHVEKRLPGWAQCL